MNVWYEQDNENEHPPEEVDDSVNIIFFNYLKVHLRNSSVLIV